MKRLLVFAMLSFIVLGVIGSAFVSLFGPVAIPLAAAGQPEPLRQDQPVATKTPRPQRTPGPTETLFPTATLAPSSTLQPTATTMAVNLPANYGPNFYPDGINPLTGLQVADPALLHRPPMAIKITNYPRLVRPQSGITLADLIFEYYIETGLTRFIAVFYGSDAREVGPIRSGRFFDEHIVRMYHALFVFASADKRVLEPWMASDLAERLVIPRPYNCPPLCRDKSKPDAYNNLYTDTSLLPAYIARRGVPVIRHDLSGMRFQTIVPWGGELGSEISLRYSRLSFNRWQYNPASGSYERSQETSDDAGQGEIYAPMYDKITGEPVAAENVVVLLVPHEEFVKSSDTEIFKIHLTGSGPAYVFRDGKVFEATWARVAEESPLQIFRADAASGPFPLKPGRTFFQIIGTTSDVLPDGISWRFVFHIP